MTEQEITAMLDAAPVALLTIRTVREREPDCDGWYWANNRYASGTCPHCAAKVDFPICSIGTPEGDGYLCPECKGLFTATFRTR